MESQLQNEAGQHDHATTARSARYSWKKPITASPSLTRIAVMRPAALVAMSISVASIRPLPTAKLSGRPAGWSRRQAKILSPASVATTTPLRAVASTRSCPSLTPVTGTAILLCVTAHMAAPSIEDHAATCPVRMQERQEACHRPSETPQYSWCLVTLHQHVLSRSGSDDA